MTNIVKRRVFTARDYDAIKARVLGHLQQTFPTIFNDTRENHFPVVALEFAAKIGDELHFALEYVFNELQIDTVGERSNIASVVKLINYPLRNLTAAKVRLNCVCNAYAPANLTLPRGTVVSTRQTGIQFYLLQDFSFSGQTQFIIEAFEGFLREDQIISNGNTDQRFITQYNNVADNVPVELEVDGVIYTKVDSLFIQDADAEVYEQSQTRDLRLLFRMGDGVHGKKPPAGAIIKIRYGTCSGIDGNIAANRIRTNINGNLSGGGTLSVAVDNQLNKAAGGENEESTEEARINAPLSIKRIERTLSRDDLRAAALKFPGVIAANVAIDNQHNAVTVYLVAAGYVEPPQSLIDDFKLSIDLERLMGLILVVKSPTFVFIDVAAEVVVEDTVNLVTAKDDLTELVRQTLQPDDPILAAKDFGEDVFLSDINALLDTQAGVRYVNMQKLTRQGTVYLISWHSTTSVFENVAIGQSAVNETWAVRFISPTTFKVSGSVSGAQSQIGTVGTDYITEGQELSFRIDQGVDPNEQGDVAFIVVGAFLGNVVIHENEFSLAGNINLDVKYAPLGFVR